MSDYLRWVRTELKGGARIILELYLRAQKPRNKHD